MSFSDYKSIAQVQKAYQIKYEEIHFIDKRPAAIDESFAREFAFNLENLDTFSSEAARCELIILPVLREAYKHYAAKFSLWVQKPISYDDVLNGTPDYLISKRSPLGKTVLEMPLLIVAEAKKNDFEQGWGQCLAELVAAQKMNDKPALTVYGIVTDGKYWEFGRLTGSAFSKNIASFSVDDLPELFGALDAVFELARKEAD